MEGYCRPCVCHRLSTGDVEEMLNAGSIIIKEMNSLVIVRLLLIGPCLHKSGQGAVQCSSPYNHYRSGSSGIRIRFTEGFIFKTSSTNGMQLLLACMPVTRADSGCCTSTV